MPSCQSLRAGPRRTPVALAAVSLRQRQASECLPQNPTRYGNSAQDLLLVCIRLSHGPTSFFSNTAILPLRLVFVRTPSPLQFPPRRRDTADDEETEREGSGVGIGVRRNASSPPAGIFALTHNPAIVVDCCWPFGASSRRRSQSTCLGPPWCHWCRGMWLAALAKQNATYNLAGRVDPVGVVSRRRRRICQDSEPPPPFARVNASYRPPLVWASPTTCPLSLIADATLCEPPIALRRCTMPFGTRRVIAPSPRCNTRRFLRVYLWRSRLSVSALQ